MATSQFIKSTAKDSEETFDVLCSTCAENSKTRKAESYCKDCESYLCKGCLQEHNKFPALRRHVITDTSGLILEHEAKGASVYAKKEDIPMCKIHYGQDVVKFCKDHDEVCCQTCMVAKHRSCKNTVNLADAARDVKNSTDYNTKKPSLVDVLALLTKERTRKAKHLSDIKTEKAKILQDADKYREELIARINEIYQDSKKEILSMYEGIENNIQTDISTIETISATSNQTLQNLTTESDVKAFIHSKTCMPIVEECRQLLQYFTTHSRKQRTTPTVNRDILNRLSQFKTLFCRDHPEEDVKEYQTVSRSNVSLRSGVSQIIGVCILADGKAVVANFTESRLERFDLELNVEDSVKLQSGPYAVCQTGVDEVATCVGNKVQFVAIHKPLSCTSNIDVGCSCYGISYIQEKKEMVISCGSMLKVYNQETKSFTIIIQKNNTGSSIFTNARLSIFSPTMDRLFVADSTNHSVIALNRDGEIQWRFTDPELKDVWGVCVLPGGIILVSGSFLNKIIQVDKTGKKIGVLVDNIDRPISMAYDVQKSRLVVGCIGTDLYVYDLKKVLK